MERVVLIRSKHQIGASNIHVKIFIIRLRAGYREERAIFSYSSSTATVLLVNGGCEQRVRRYEVVEQPLINCILVVGASAKMDQEDTPGRGLFSAA